MYFKPCDMECEFFQEQMKNAGEAGADVISESMN